MCYLDKKLLAKKLLYQSRNRGSKETCLILTKFAEYSISDMDIDSLKNFSLILDQNDIDIYDWITNKTSPPSHLNSKIMFQLLNFDINHLL